MIAGARPSARGSTASLHGLPEPLISTRGSVLHQTFTVDLAPTSRLLMREEQLLGRSGEAPGHLTTRLTVRRGGRPLLDQHSAYGHPAPAWDGSAEGHAVLTPLADPKATPRPSSPPPSPRRRPSCAIYETSGGLRERRERRTEELRWCSGLGGPGAA
ncbi:MULTISPECIES: urease accessory protein UreD [Streptomyces]|uniref:Urease accessory protein UreD n=1 Tax=Streptomyces rochei TaxID=1928 RepID=A0ABW7DZD9_STRRO